MVSTTVTNTPVAISLEFNESTTVPTGEVWKVSITLSPATATINTDPLEIAEAGAVDINGEWIMSNGDGDDQHGRMEGVVLVAGDTVTYAVDNERTQSMGVYISGFVVN